MWVLELREGRGTRTWVASKHTSTFNRWTTIPHLVHLTCWLAKYLFFFAVIFRIKQEWDLALINVLTVTACNAIVVWSLAPCRSYGNTFRFDLQNTLQKLPNNIFEKSYPLREFDLQKRVQSFFYRAAELCMVGLTAGTVQGALSNLAASKKEGR